MTAYLTQFSRKKLQRLCVFFLAFLASLIFSARELAAQNLSALTPEESKQKRSEFVDAALAYRGTPYRYGGSSKSGIDCSGLICRAGIEGPGISLPRTADSLSRYAQRISDSELEPGDLVFFSSSGGRISHAGIYLGNGEFVHSASSGPKTGVIVSKLSESYWRRTYSFSGRIFPSAAAASSAAVASASNASSSSTSSSSSPPAGSSSSSTQPSPQPVPPPPPAGSSSSSTQPAPQPVPPPPPPAGSSSSSTQRPSPVRAKSYSPYGVRVELRGTALWDFSYEDWFIRGATASATLQWRGRSKFYPGITAGFTWDTRHDTMSVPLYLSVTARNGLAFFVGTQFIFYSGGEGSKEIFFPGLVGASWTSPYKDLGAVKIGFYQSVECVFVRKEGVAGRMLSDVFRLSTGVTFAFGK